MSACPYPRCSGGEVGVQRDSWGVWDTKPCPVCNGTADVDPRELLTVQAERDQPWDQLVEWLTPTLPVEQRAEAFDTLRANVRALIRLETGEIGWADVNDRLSCPDRHDAAVEELHGRIDEAIDRLLGIQRPVPLHLPWFHTVRGGDAA